MIREILKLLARDSLQVQALNECYEMLDLCQTMVRASVESLRERDDGSVDVDIAEMDIAETTDATSVGSARMTDGATAATAGSRTVAGVTTATSTSAAMAGEAVPIDPGNTTRTGATPTDATAAAATPDGAVTAIAAVADVAASTSVRTARRASTAGTPGARGRPTEASDILTGDAP